MHYTWRGIGFGKLSDNYLGSTLQTTYLFRNSLDQGPAERGRDEGVFKECDNAAITTPKVSNNVCTS